MSDIFLSYANDDHDRVERVVQALEHRGWSVFWDRHVTPGQKWEEVLETHLANARCVVVLWSARSVDSPWVNFEAGVAKHRRVLVPARLDAEVKIPAMFTALQAPAKVLDASGSLGPGFEALTGSISALLSKRKLFLQIAAGVFLLLLAFGLGAAKVARESASARSARASAEAAERAAREILAATGSLGLKHVGQGKYSTAENDRLGLHLRTATTIKFIGTNASSLTQNFREDFEVFFSRPKTSMEVLLGKPGSDFYREMTEMTMRKDWDPKSAPFKSNEDLVQFSRQRLEDLTHDLGKVQFRYFNTQYRATIILIDDRYCYLTLRLPPDESASPRLEFEDGYAANCKAHFDKLWGMATPM
jgi:hypothetical protein